MPMPYTLTKGPLLTLLENTLNPTNQTETAIRNDALDALRGGTAITAIPWVSSAPVSAVPLPTQAPLSERLDSDWFGGGATPIAQGQPTGYWVGYQGDVEGVLREGIIRAMEVSMGINHAGDAGAATRRWPVDIQWKCPNPWFEVWVTWRRHQADSTQGQVNMIIATPPDKYNRLATEPLHPPSVPGVPAVPTPLPEPTTADDRQGMWLITHEHHIQHTVDQLVDVAEQSPVGVLLDAIGALFGLPKHQWAVPMPTTYWEDTGDVIVVAPPSYAGGADVGRTNAP